MTDKHLSLYIPILEHPDDDDRRLVYADLLEEAGQGERAEFIRVQVELAGLDSILCHQTGAKPGDWCNNSLCPKCGKENALHRRERELRMAHDLEWVPREVINTCDWIGYPGGYVDMVPWQYHRGFVAALTCTAANFLAHADELLWRPGQACGECGGNGRIAETRQTWSGWRECPACRGNKCRPMPPSAVPLESVRLTTDLPYLWLSGRVGYDFSRQAMVEALHAEWPQIPLEGWHLPGI